MSRFDVFFIPAIRIDYEFLVGLWGTCGGRGRSVDESLDAGFVGCGFENAVNSI